MLRKGLFCILLFIGIVHFSLGEEIGQEEQGKYQLFQNIKGFKSTVLRVSNDRYALNISYGNEKTGELKFALSQQSKISIKSCGKYIDHFEEIQSQKNQKASAAAEEKDFYIIPRIGLSSFTGFIGIELQYKHFALGIGYLYGGGPR